ncbi:iron-sulfur cluster-binding protein [Roseospira marina]|uniref:Iron-sulfur cluster-binding protein n=1 Tax=Roseospira marina TaxID=140057 RepID=A0A5M6I976_9PROT|nr:LutB/LldF family L-lactate oxidation iron-sulfur protein [Roseospira marina]KAA5604315.1 iron-sulfur cluster-binding protein [Roseospira marina]MBB4315661.1 L-lactate dehydrogenase complex protein LldF [Roseospira marina]MBB5088719.1 L-lactate dehydrogenase complex protein LldF [Roseospira marina]
MHVTSRRFKDNVRGAVNDANLRQSLATMKTGFRVKRGLAVAALPEFEALREAGKAIKTHTLEHLDHYLEHFEARVLERGGHVHWAPDAETARRAVLDICRTHGAKTVTKGKSMVAEEIELNAFLEGHGIRPVETDLGEYIIQLRHELPSHIIAPAIHVRKSQVASTFRESHPQFPADRPLEEPRELLDEARTVLREHFLGADVGITGANFLVAETGSSVIVTNEGNGDLTQLLPRVHIVVTSIEKVVPTLEDTGTLLRLLARSATGQIMSSYTTVSTGPRRPDDPDGPDHFHVVLLDNGRSRLLGGEFQDVLRCIRCAACINHCPVYGAVGGHAYGSVYPGPIGSVLTPGLASLEESASLPNASTLCGRCEEVCPMKIPLPRMLRHWREQEFARHLTPARTRWGLRAWAFAARRPWLYRLGTGLAGRLLSRLGRGRGRLARLPLAGGWTQVRDLPVPPPGGTFMARYKRGETR